MEFDTPLLAAEYFDPELFSPSSLCNSLVSPPMEVEDSHLKGKCSLWLCEPLKIGSNLTNCLEEISQYSEEESLFFLPRWPLCAALENDPCELCPLPPLVQELFLGKEPVRKGCWCPLLLVLLDLFKHVKTFFDFVNVFDSFVNFSSKESPNNRSFLWLSKSCDCSFKISFTRAWLSMSVCRTFDQRWCNKD